MMERTKGQAKVEWTGNENKNKEKHTGGRGVKDIEPRWRRRQETRKKTRKTRRRNGKQKQRNTDGRSGSVSNCKQCSLLHHADLMPHSTGAAVLCEEMSRGGQDRQ
jgi:hypothetical protein